MDRLCSNISPKHFEASLATYFHGIGMKLYHSIPEFSSISRMHCFGLTDVFKLAAGQSITAPVKAK